MSAEYLIFNIIVAAGPVYLTFTRGANFAEKAPKALAALALMAAVFVPWDILVTGRHWWFNDAYTLGFHIAGLPLGEWLFFLTVPYACIFTWEMFFAAKNDVPGKPFLRGVQMALPLLVPFGGWVFSTGLEYTGLALISLGLTALLDIVLRTHIFQRATAYLFTLMVAGLILIFNGYLTARPVVLYGEEYQLGFRIITIPVEDFIYGFALLLGGVVLYQRFMGRVQHG